MIEPLYCYLSPVTFDHLSLSTNGILGPSADCQIPFIRFCLANRPTGTSRTPQVTSLVCVVALSNVHFRAYLRQCTRSDNEFLFSCEYPSIVGQRCLYGMKIRYSHAIGSFVELGSLCRDDAGGYQIRTKAPAPSFVFDLNHDHHLVSMAYTLHSIS